jgi:hypothetical protein
MQYMQTIDETRRQRLDMLIKKHGGIAPLNESIGLARTDATISQIKNKSVHSKTGTPRAMGDSLARRIEVALGLPSGWMDTPPTQAERNGFDDQRSKIACLIESLPDDQLAFALRLLHAIDKPEQGNGTNG